MREKWEWETKSLFRGETQEHNNETKIYNRRIQKVNTKELPKRSRYYQSVLDMQLLEKGKSYRELRKSFVIFICLEDIFGQGRHIYTFENTCKGDRELLLCDETTKIFLNAAGTKDDIKGELKAFLDYLKGEWLGKKTELSEDVYIQELDRAVKRAKHRMQGCPEEKIKFQKQA